MADSGQIRILIVDDHAIVRTGLRALIEAEEDMTLLGEAANGNEAVLKARSLQPDVILMDLVMPQKDGIEAIRDITEENPSARILVLTSFADDDKVFSAIKVGALGYVLKDSLPETLLEAIRDVYRGEPSLSPAIARKVIRELGREATKPAPDELLTSRELEVLKLVAQGLTDQDIATRLTISKRTVSSHIGNILSKLHLANRTQAALFALRRGVVSLDDE